VSVEKIIGDWKKQRFKPVYWLEGEEEYYIDKLVYYAEHEILSEADAAFNLTVFYGKDADWAAVINACRRYPMFAERQVVLLKEAQQMRDLDKLEGYIDKPLTSTVCVDCPTLRSKSTRAACCTWSSIPVFTTVSKPEAVTLT